ncbi:hypothetical protein Aperf_G00000023753 [Anoplocephala perfoliata]
MQNRVVSQVAFSLLWCLITLITCKADMLPALFSYTMTEDSPVPLILGDILGNLQARTSFQENVADILIFPSSQPFSEYFQLVQKRQINQVLVSSELQLIRPFDLETACKKRLSLQHCTQTNYECCCDHHSLFCSIKLQLAVTVEGGIFHTATQQTPFKAFLIEVKIFDQNDQTPVFTPNVFTLKINEGTKFNEKYRLPIAKDGDLGQNSEVSYSLGLIHGRTPNSQKWRSILKENGLFSIATGPQTLSLLITGHLDREEIETYKILIEAQDRAIYPTMRKTGTLTVSLIVTDVNDVSPTFKSQNLTVSVPENSAVGTVICTIMAQDYDSGPNGQINYSIVQNQRDLPFKIDAETGLLTVAGELDRERVEEYRIIIEATDRGTPARTSTLPVYIKIVDINDNPPIISVNSVFMESANSTMPVLRISEELSVGTNIANVSVSDLDASANKTISCSVLDDAYELHQTSFSTYSLQLAKQLDYETESRLEIRMFCQDSGEPYSLKSEAVIEVEVLNENDNPPVFQEPMVVPPAWLVNSTEVGQFSAILDSKEKISIGEGSEGDFTVFVPKSFPLGDAFMRFKAKDPDFSLDRGEWEDALHFSLNIREEQRFQPESSPALISHFGKSILFSFSGKTGEVFLTATPNFDGIISVFKGDITVYDRTSKPHSTTKNFTFIVGESNTNAPLVRIFNFALANSLSPYQIFDQEQNSSVLEVPFYIPRQSQSNSVIGQIVGTDPDPGQAGRITYNLTFPQSSCMNLSINNSTGLLTLLEINHNSTGECQIQADLNVTDNGFPKRFTPLLISFCLFDANKLSPKIRINQSLIPMKWSENSELEWDFTAIVPKIGEPLFHFEVKIIPGLVEPTYQIKFCTSTTDNYGKLQGISIDENSGLIYVADSNAHLNTTVYVTISNHLWPSLPPSIFKTEMKSSENATIAVRITEVKTIDCQIQPIFEVGPSSFRRNFKTFCIGMLSLAALLCLLIIILVIFLRGSMRKITTHPLADLFKKKQRHNFYEKVHFQSNSIEVNEPVNCDEEYGSCLQTRIPTQVIAPREVLLKAPNFPAASSAVRIESGRVSTIAIKQLAPGCPAVSEISDAYYVMENTHQTDHSPKFHSPKDTTPAHSRRSPSSVGSVETEIKPTAGHANVNIIVHNDFEKAVPLQQISTLNRNYKSTKPRALVRDLCLEELSESVISMKTKLLQLNSSVSIEV